MREPIDQAKLSGDQRQTLDLVSRTDLHAAINSLLQERGIPLRVYRLEMSAVQPAAEAAVASPSMMPEPPPGGCYCCVDGACYCC